MELPKIVENADEPIPEEFYDSIYGTLMENPWKDGHEHTLDKSSWDRLSKNPFTQKPINNITPNIELKEKIEAFKKKYPEVWKKAKE